MCGSIESGISRTIGHVVCLAVERRAFDGHYLDGSLVPSTLGMMVPLVLQGHA